MPGVIVMGGSLGGLTAALVLRDAGCDVRVFERSSAALQGRGAGIAALEATLRYLTERGGARPGDVCSSTGWIRFLRADGSAAHEQRHRYLFSSWNTIYRSLMRHLEPSRYVFGGEVVAFEESGDGVSVTLADGAQARAGLLVCADGVGSAARARLVPGVAPAVRGLRGLARHASRNGACHRRPGRSSRTRSPTRCWTTATSSSTRSRGRTGRWPGAAG